MLKHSLWGEFLSTSAGNKNNTTLEEAKGERDFLPAELKVGTSYSVSKKDRLVKTGKKIVKKTGNDEKFEIEPAKLFLYASYFLRNAENGGYERMEESFEVDPNGGGDLTVVREDLKPAKMTCGFNKEFQGNETEDNFDQTKEKMKAIVEDLKSKYKLEAGSTNVYAGIIPVQLNGRIVSLNYQINQGGSVTTINIDSDVGTDITPPASKATEEAATKQALKAKELELKLIDIFSPVEAAMEREGMDA